MKEELEKIKEECRRASAYFLAVGGEDATLYKASKATLIAIEHFVGLFAGAESRWDSDVAERALKQIIDAFK